MPGEPSIFPTFNAFSSLVTQAIGPGYTDNLFSISNAVYGLSDFFSIVRAKEAVDKFDETLKRWRSNDNLQKYKLRDVLTVASLSLVLRPACLIIAFSGKVFQSASTAIYGVASSGLPILNIAPKAAGLYGFYKTAKAALTPEQSVYGWWRNTTNNYQAVRTAITQRNFRGVVLPSFHLLLNCISVAAPVVAFVPAFTAFNWDGMVNLWNLVANSRKPGFVPVKYQFPAARFDSIGDTLASGLKGFSLFCQYYGAWCMTKDLLMLATDPNSVLYSAANSWLNSINKLRHRNFDQMTAYDYVNYLATAAVVAGVASLAFAPAGFSWFTIAGYFQHYNMAVNIIKTLFDDAQWGFKYSWRQNLWELSKKGLQIGFMFYIVPSIFKDLLNVPFMLPKIHIADPIIGKITSLLAERQILSNITSLSELYVMPLILTAGAAAIALFSTRKAHQINNAKAETDVSKAAAFSEKAMKYGLGAIAVVGLALTSTSLAGAAAAAAVIMAVGGYYALGGKAMIRYAEQILPMFALAYTLYAKEFISLGGLPASKALLLFAAFKVLRHSASNLHFDATNFTLTNMLNAIPMVITTAVGIAVGAALLASSTALAVPGFMAMNALGLTSFSIAIYNAKGILNSLFRRYEPHQTNAEALIKHIGDIKEKLQKVIDTYTAEIARNPANLTLPFNPMTTKLTTMMTQLDNILQQMQLLLGQSVSKETLATIPNNPIIVATSQIAILKQTVLEYQKEVTNFKIAHPTNSQNIQIHNWLDSRTKELNPISKMIEDVEKAVNNIHSEDYNIAR